VPPYFIWIEYISFLKYSFRAVVLNEFTNLTFTCTAKEEILTPTGKRCPIADGQQVIDQFGFDSTTLTQDALILLGLWAFFRLVNYILISWRANTNKQDS